MTPLQGLFAFDGEQFFHHLQAQPDLDHIAWFEKIGLASHGPAFDAILRGKVTYDLDTDKVIIGYYGAAYLSNRRYRSVAEAFEIDEDQAEEKMLNEPY